ncbi:MAG: T9SS type A sorting domain-containing protein [Bacteroidales bacterium]|nr:T9SS type A sorting domain-containing protein [Bacteroidales bacterium]
MKSFITFILLIPSFYLCGQNLILKDKEGNHVNNDSVEVIFYPGQYHGWVEITSEIFIENIGNDTLEVGFRKVQYDTAKAHEYHSFCFAGSCYDSSTYVAPFPTYIYPGKIDSSFSGHFRFDDILHQAGKYVVSYHFYNVNDSLDTAMVYVVYNTLNQVSIEESFGNIFTLNAFPNPTTDRITIAYDMPAIEKNYSLVITNVCGQCVYKQALQTTTKVINIDTKGWSSGLYFYGIVEDTKCIITKKFLITD